ncbi:hypothetical protein ACX80I_01150 [Arthrobacter sp. MDT3-44]
MAAAIAPLALEYQGQAAEDAPVSAVVDAVAPAPSGAAGDLVADPAPSTGGQESPVPEDTPPAPAPAPAPAWPGSGMGGDLPPGSLPVPPYPECPITEAGAWWTDPADPYTCIPPGSVPFHEPTPPGIDPELLEPIFEEPQTQPGPGDDCRLVGALQCTVTIMGQDYVVTFSDGKPVGVAEARQ